MIEDNKLFGFYGSGDPRYNEAYMDQMMEQGRFGQVRMDMKAAINQFDGTDETRIYYSPYDISYK